jgi:hypothetical protein
MLSRIQIELIRKQRLLSYRKYIQDVLLLLAASRIVLIALEVNSVAKG